MNPLFLIGGAVVVVTIVAVLLKTGNAEVLADVIVAVIEGLLGGD